MGDKQFTPIISQLPFKGHELEHDVMNVLLSAMGGDAGVVGKMVTSDSLVRSIEIASTLSSPVSPLVIESLLRPIAGEWTAAERAKVQVQQFWLRRRARPLEEFIPAPQEHILAMCRGWFTGVVLGLIKRDVASSIDNSALIRIARRNDSPASFPAVTLSRSSHTRDQLPLVLESLSLAYVGVSQAGDLQPLAAYIALRDLGVTDIDDHNIFEYKRLGWALEAWARTGTAAGSLSPALVSGDTYAERLASIQELLSKLRSDYVAEYETLRDTWRKQPAKLGEPPYWPGLRRPILGALDQLVGALTVAIADSASAGTSGGGDLI
jgi:hypothetical protein